MQADKEVERVTTDVEKEGIQLLLMHMQQPV